MFTPDVYSERRNRLRKEVSGGIALFLGNREVCLNYPANTYAFRQDSSFSYFFGLDHPDLAAVIDFDNGTDMIFGNDVDIDDIIWMGKQPSMKDQAALAGVREVKPFADLGDFISAAVTAGRKVHYLPPYRGETYIQLHTLLGIPVAEVKKYASGTLIRGVVKLRMVKEATEVAEIEKMVDVAYEMHTTAMKMAKPGVVEREIAGVMEGIALSKAHGVSFPIILTINGQTLHNHYHGNVLKTGRMLVSDAGAESELLYSSDITRTVPVGGKFDARQKAVYEIVLNANLKAIGACKPGVPFKEIHLLAAKAIMQGLVDIGLMKGDITEGVLKGAHTLFFPHGLGHPMGMDVHDLEGLGEDVVGYDEEVQRAKEFGLAFLRFGRKLKEGFVMTIEPGIYFIPDLIDLWKAENKHSEYINYDEVEKYREFGGIRIEDDILITADGCRVLGKHIPKTVAEIEEIMK